ncbi:MAG: septum site-determining protein MinD, partial [Peptococcaceae bacterium]|nr:septum site-determining protein MinD [Peptococcaceae bacterium]
TNPEVSAVRDADRIIGLLEANGLGNPQLVLNRVRPNMVRQGDMMSVDDILEILAIKLLGVIPDDDNIVISTNRGEPTVLDQQSRAGQAYRNIVKRILGEDVPLMNLDVEEGFFAKLKKLFKGN